MVAVLDLSLVTTLFFSLFLLKWSNGLFLQASPEKIAGKSAEATKNSGGAESVIVDELDQKVLNMFGLSKRPTSNRNVRVPKLMQHLYKSHMGDYYEEQHDIMEGWETGFDLPPHHVTSRMNTARSFHHIDKDETLPGMPDHHIRLRFDLSTLPDEEVIGSSELLLHREAIVEHLLEDHDHLHRINVYEIIKMLRPSKQNLNAAGLENKNKSTPLTRLLDTRVVDLRNSTWERFDVSLAALKWTQNHPDENHGLLVEVVDGGSGNPPQGEKKKHVRLKRDLHPEVGDHDWVDRRPTLVAYTHDGKATNLQRRARRSNLSINSNSRKREINTSRKKKRRKKKNRPCARHSLYVDFSAVGWNDWIVAPHGYDAFYCQGQCLFPLAEHLNATNHAIVQTLANSVDPLMVPRPCCVPTELSSISMLYVDEHDLVVLKSYPHMVVDACGCK